MRTALIKIALITLLAMAIFQARPDLASAESIKESFKQSIDETAQGTGHAELAGQLGTDLPSTISFIIKALLGTCGVIFLGLFIYGGYVWFAAKGNESEVSKARMVLRNAVIGFIIIAVAYGITDFVGNAILKGLGNK